jgi:hypothetical protein
MSSPHAFSRSSRHAPSSTALPRAAAGRAPWLAIAIAGIVVALAGAEFYALLQHGRPQRATDAPVAVAPAERAIGWLDRPTEETVIGAAVQIDGWALDRAGVAAVEVRLDERRYRAAIGIARADVAQEHPGYPDSAHAGFTFTGDFAAELAHASAGVHALAIVVVARDGRETEIARRRLVATTVAPFAALLDRHPALAARRLMVLMMTSGVGAGGANEIDAVYRPYRSRTTAIGFAVPILYLRTTAGADNDWRFDPAFDVSRQCGTRSVADDNLDGAIAFATRERLPVQFILNGGIWADATCDTPQWDVNDHLEQDAANCQWTQRNEVLPDDYRKQLAGSTQSPELARSLTYNVYAARVRHYKRRNLQAAATIVAAFARAHPELFAGIVLDADTYMNPFVREGRWYDYNPGMLKQFRHWLAGSGPYAGRGEPGTPDLSAYRRADPLSLADVNRIARQHWGSWDDVDPPRTFPGEDRSAVPSGAVPFWDDPWFGEWDGFRKHVVALHYDELAQWVHATGIPRDRIFSAQAFIAPDAGMRPVSRTIRGASPDYDSAGVSIAGAIPRAGHLGAILYGPAAQNRHPLDDGHSLFATFARMDPGWGIVEYNPTDLKAPQVLPDYAATYRTLRDLANFDGRQIAVMAWNGSNGTLAGEPGYVPYTAWRNTPGESALFDFLASHADLPLGARLWTFGTPRYADDDGWSLEQGALAAERGAVAFATTTHAALVSPPDQVVREENAARLVLGLESPRSVAQVQVFARTGSAGPWVALTGPVPGESLAVGPAGVEVPLAWPRAWQASRAIAERIRIALEFTPQTREARIAHIALYPRSPATDSTIR